jgi:signal peptidase I
VEGPPTTPPYAAAPPPRAGRALVAIGFALAVVSLLLGLIAAVPALVIGLLVMGRGRRAAGIAIVALSVVLPIASAILFFVVLDVRAFRAPSEAMLPTLEVGDRVLTTSAGSPAAGDVIVFRPPPGAETNACGVAKRPDEACPRPTPGRSDLHFVKRVVATGGDRVAIVEGRAVVNGERREEPYARLDPACAICNLPAEIEVPPGHLFVLGDNRGTSADSREWGPVPEDSVTGEVWIRYWPFSRFGGL